MVGGAGLQDRQNLAVLDLSGNYDERQVDGLFLNHSQCFERAEFTGREIADRDVGSSGEGTNELLAIFDTFESRLVAAAFQFRAQSVTWRATLSAGALFADH